MTIATILEKTRGHVHQVSSDETVQQAAAKLSEFRIGAVPVTNGRDVEGIFSERDLIYGLAKHGAKILDMAVRDVMTTPAITVAADTQILAALSMMTKRRIRHLPVVDKGGMVGFVSIGDLVKYRIEKIEEEANAMRDYIQMA